MISRRKFFKLMAGTAAFLAIGKGVSRMVWADTGSDGKKEKFPFELSEQEWKERLTPRQYGVLRREATEPAFSSPLYNEHRKGLFTCAGCAQTLFVSENKFDSGTGWPSFWQPADAKAVGQSTDYKLGFPRTEVHCSNCGGHLGHVFEDGPKPTGLRYCINGLALNFAAV